MVGESKETPLAVGVLASGRGSNLRALLEAQARGDLRARVAVVISDQQGAPALAAAGSFGVPAIHLDPGSPRARLAAAAENAILEVLREHQVEWIVLAGFFRIIGPVLLEAYPDHILNIHPSLLPSFPGLHGPAQALEYGVRVAGCSVHLVRAAVDEGPILAQAAVAVEEDDTELSLADRILEQEHRILVEAVNRVATTPFRLEGRRVRWAR